MAIACYLSPSPASLRRLPDTRPLRPTDRRRHLDGPHHAARFQNRDRAV